MKTKTDYTKHEVSRSERGATLSVALLLFLVCVAVAAVVLSAATASSGRFAELGKADQRYYSVTSAADLFLDSMGDNHECELIYSQTVSTTGGYERPGEGETAGEGKWNVDALSISDENNQLAIGKGNFLPQITYDSLFGANSQLDGHFKKKSSDVKSYEICTIDTNLNGAAEALRVKVDGRMSGGDDWKLELDFYNQKKKDGGWVTDDDAFHLYIVLAGDVSQSTSRTEKLANTQVGDKGPTNAKEVTEKQTTIITWRVQQIVPGRSL